MKLKQIASNMTELYLNNGTVVLFSYETPVAAVIGTIEHVKSIIRTNKKWSRTTTRHITKWFDYNFRFHPTTRCNAFSAQEVDQSVLDDLVK